MAHLAEDLATPEEGHKCQATAPSGGHRRLSVILSKKKLVNQELA